MDVNHDSRRQRLVAWWRTQSRRKRIVLITVAVLSVMWVVGSMMGPNGGTISHAQYEKWRAECEDYATLQVAGSPLYEVGGNHWVDLVNHCLTTKANDTP